MAALDSISILILLGSALVLAGILSSLVALRFGAPLLLIFLVIGMLAGESGPGGIRFDDVGLVYAVGSVALALIIFDGGLRTRFAVFRSVLGPASVLATIGVALTATLTAPAAIYALGLSWTEGLLVGAIVGSTDAAAVFFLLNGRGLRLRPRVSATIEIESATNDPAAILMTIVLVEILLVGQKPWPEVAWLLAWQAVIGGVMGVTGGAVTVFGLNRLPLPQGLHAPFVTAAALAVFGFCQTIGASGFLAVYLAGLVVGNRVTRGHGAIIAFLEAATWLGQIVMFVLLGLLSWPGTLFARLLPAALVALMLTLVARPVAVFLCLAPFEYTRREQLFISWVGLRGSVSVFLASIPLLVGLPNAQVYFDVGFVVVLLSLLVQGWTIAPAARRLRIAKKRADPFRARVELDLPGQRAQELVGYPVMPGSPFLRRGFMPPWAKIALVVRGERVLTPEEARGVHEGDHVYLLAPQDKAPALDRFFADLPPPSSPDPRLLGDFFVSGDVTLGAIAEIYGITFENADPSMQLSDLFIKRLGRAPQAGDIIRIGDVALVAHRVKDGHVLTVGLQLAEEEAAPWWRRLWNGLYRYLRA
jgi:cell volume regulation protein A